MAKRAPTTVQESEPKTTLPDDPVEVLLWDDDSIPSQGARTTRDTDGGVIVDFSPYRQRKASDSKKFDANLAESLEESELDIIASDLLQGIEEDDQSRQEWLSTHSEGMKLLGLVLEDQRSGTGTTAAPVESLSTARHPLLLEAVLSFQAMARGELLPAAGPVKVRDDQPSKPVGMPVGMGHNGGPPLDAMPMAGPAVPPMGPPAMAGPPAGPVPPVAPPVPPQVPGVAPPPASANPAAFPPPVLPGLAAPESRDALADALEKDFNHYLTTTAKEYVPDTDRMLFGVGFGGTGVKKVYNCPIRRRPVSESIAMEDFIVSDALTDLSNASRITHRISMRPSVLRRMQLLGVYRDVPLGQPTPMQPDSVVQVKSDIAGVAQNTNPKNADYDLYECYCELELDEFAPPRFKGKGVALPYRVTIDKDSRTILEIRRNWREDDPECMAREYFVEFNYDKAFGFYGIGLLHILGNLTRALTAMLRITIDGGMYSNFPAFIFNKGLGRQLNNQFMAAPGQGVGLDTGLQSVRDAIMPFPYKGVDAAWTQFQASLTELGQRLGSMANIGVGEGKQDAPVGTTLALIEQATKQIGAALKRMHAAQGKEFQLLKERFRDDPEAFWRFNKRPTMPWQKEQFVKALEDYDLVPVSDPNNPTRMHRAAKSEWVKQTAIAAPTIVDGRKAFVRSAQYAEIDDPEDLMLPLMPSTAPQPSPADQAKLAQVNAKLQGDTIKSQADVEKVRIQQQGDIAELQLRLQIAQTEQDTERLRLASNIAMHSDKIDAAREALAMKIGAEQQKQARDHLHEYVNNQQAAQKEQQE